MLYPAFVPSILYREELTFPFLIIQVSLDIQNTASCLNLTVLMIVNIWNLFLLSGIINYKQDNCSSSVENAIGILIGIVLNL